jgi:hypothetical protein
MGLEILPKLQDAHCPEERGWMTNYLNVHALNDADQDRVIDLAHNRRGVARSRPGDPYFNDNLNKPEIWWEIHSTGAEIAYLRLTGGVKAAEGAPWDVQVDGHKVDVKWTPWPNGVLLVKNKTWSQGMPEWFALFTGNFPVFEYKGRFRAETLLARPVNRDPKYKKPGHTAEQAELDQTLMFWPKEEQDGQV